MGQFMQQDGSWQPTPPLNPPPVPNPVPPVPNPVPPVPRVVQQEMVHNADATAPVNIVIVTADTEDIGSG